jgi:CheY-like chemotaxis protein/HPt (histidine-containing phosphotransfer) domain-containing protein
MTSDCATNGAEAMQCLEHAAASGQPYEVVILDMQMPEMDGLSVTKAIRAHPTLANTRIVILTSVICHLDPETLSDLRLDAYLVKPAKQQRLQECLALALERNVALLQKEEKTSAPARQEQSPPQAPDPEAAKIRVLLVEDNPVNQKLAHHQLQKLGFTVISVADGIEAIEAAGSGFDIVLMDCQMPRMDGYEATREIRKRERSSGLGRHYIVAMTANAMAGDREKCIAAGMDDYISKPVQIEDLQAVLQRGIDYRRNSKDPYGISYGRKPAVDAGALESLRALNEDPETDLFGEIVQLYFSTAEESLVRIQNGFGAGDTATVSSEAHSLKGSSSNLGASELANLCKDLQEVGKQANMELIGPLIEQIKAEYGRVRALLSEECRKKN